MQHVSLALLPSLFFVLHALKRQQELESTEQAEKEGFFKEWTAK